MNENSHGLKRLVTTVPRRMRMVLLVILVLWLAAPARAQTAPPATYLKEPVTFRSHNPKLAGLAYLKSLPYVDQSRLAVAGCSYGGIQTLLAAERGAGYKAAVAISPAALSWNGNPLLQDRLILAVRKIAIPVLLIQPPKDASLEPSRVLGREFQRLGKPYTGKIYPEDIQEDLQTHCFGGIRRGSRIWAQDVLAFLAEVF